MKDDYLSWRSTGKWRGSVGPLQGARKKSFQVKAKLITLSQHSTKIKISKPGALKQGPQIY